MVLIQSLWVVVAVFGIQPTSSKTLNSKRYDWDRLENHTNYNLLYWGNNCDQDKLSPAAKAENPTNYIFMGTPIYEGTYPFVVLLRPNRCSGSILNKWWILTAARCYSETEVLFQYMDAESTLVPGPWAQTRGVAEQILPMNHSATGFRPVHDIMLVRVDVEITFTDYIQPICMTPPAYRHCLDESGEVLAVGWGQPGKPYGKKDFKQNDARSVLMKLLQSHTCNTTLSSEEKNFNPKYQVCTESSTVFGLGGALCSGDTGAPLFKIAAIGSTYLRAYQVGIFSQGPSCYHSDPFRLIFHKVHIYSKVSYYILWILDNIRDFEGQG